MEMLKSDMIQCDLYLAGILLFAYVRLPPLSRYRSLSLRQRRLDVS
jgi:hypothetical protein